MDTNAFAHHSVRHCSTDLLGARPLAESDPGLPEMSGCVFRHPAGTPTRVGIRKYQAEPASRGFRQIVFDGDPKLAGFSGTI